MIDPFITVMFMCLVSPHQMYMNQIPENVSCWQTVNYTTGEDMKTFWDEYNLTTQPAKMGTIKAGHAWSAYMSLNTTVVTMKRAYASCIYKKDRTICWNENDS